MSAARSVHERKLEVNYESLAYEAPRLGEYLGIDPAPLAAGLSQYRESSIGRIRRDLSPEQPADVERVAGALLRELGYRETGRG